MYKRRKKTFRWQINASAVGKLLGHFGRDNQQRALAECWHMNLKRMPRFGAVPADAPTQKLVAEVVREQLDSKPVYKQLVEEGISEPLQQKKMTEKIQTVAKEEVVSTKRKYTKAIEEMEASAEIKILLNYKTRKAGLSQAKIGFFTSKGNVYHKTNGRTVHKSTMEDAIQSGYRPLVQKTALVKAATNKMVVAKKEKEIAVVVEAHAQKAATKVINTTRGIRREATDLELVQKRFPNVRSDNNKAYFMNIGGNPYAAFVIGKIDGISSSSESCIFELKHRQSRLFGELRNYEQVQCIMYMVMVKLPRLRLVETYQGEQLYYELKLDANGQCQYRPEGGSWKSGLRWGDIKGSIERVVQDLNRAETDPKFRQHLKTFLF